MSDDKFINKYRIPSARAPWHGYDGGAYFVSICTQQRKHYFGEIGKQILCDASVETVCDASVETVCTPSLQQGEPQMQLSPIGKYAHEQFANVTEHYPYAEIPLFVIMPNHIHAVVLVDGKCWESNKNPPMKCKDGVPKCRDGVHTVSTNAARWKSFIVNKSMQNISRQKGPLSVIIGGLKRSITRYANEHHIPFAWQTRFHDHIIRNQDEMNRIALYIEQNVAKWDEDELAK